MITIGTASGYTILYDEKRKLVTSNKDIEQLKESTSRIFSRLCDVDLSVVVANTASDFRLRRVKE